MKESKVEQPPRLFRLLLEVEHLETAVPFYQTLLGAPGRAVGGGRHYFDCGGVIVGLVDVAAGGRAARPLSDYLYFAVGDVDAVHKRASELGGLSAEDVHGAPAGEVVRRPWGERSFYAVDPFGNRLCFVASDTVFTGRAPAAP